MDESAMMVVAIAGGLITFLWIVTWFLVPFKVYAMAKDIKAIRVHQTSR